MGWLIVAIFMVNIFHQVFCFFVKDKGERPVIKKKPKKVVQVVKPVVKKETPKKPKPPKLSDQEYTSLKFSRTMNYIQDELSGRPKICSTIMQATGKNFWGADEKNKMKLYHMNDKEERLSGDEEKEKVVEEEEKVEEAEIKVTKEKKINIIYEDEKDEIVFKKT